MDRFEASRRRKALRERAIAYKGGRCEVCGYDRCPAAFDFHHVDPTIKDFTISQRMSSFEAIQRELDKCVLLCSRCHREVHEGLHPRFLTRYDDDRQGFWETVELDDPGAGWE